MAKLHKLVLQFGHYRASLNWLRRTLILERVSQADLARYLQLDPANLSEILNGRSIPNAALFDYIMTIFNTPSSYFVFKSWLVKYGRSSLSLYRNRSFVPLTAAEDYD